MQLNAIQTIGSHRSRRFDAEDVRFANASSGDVRDRDSRTCDLSDSSPVMIALNTNRALRDSGG
jgi:hypothetical protein